MLIQIAAALFLLGLLIFIHELGHFLVAKWAGVKVLKFSIGFGRPIFRRKRGETEYVLAWIPLGGYVKMLGEAPDEKEEIPPEDLPRSFERKPIWKRFLVIFAGPASNLILPVFLFAAIGVIGFTVAHPVITKVVAGSIGEAAGLREGDRIVAVGGDPVERVADFQRLGQKAELPLALTVEREGERIDLSVGEQYAKSPRPLAGYPIGMLLDPDEPVVAKFLRRSEARDAGILEGDRILAINGTEVKGTFDAGRKLKDLETYPVTFQILRGERKVEVVLGGRFEHGQPIRTKPLGIEFALEIPVIGVGAPGSPAYDEGLRTGDEIVEVNGSPIRFLSDVAPAIAESPTSEVEVTVRRLGGWWGSETLTFTLAQPSPKALASGAPILPALGIYKPDLFIREAERGRAGFEAGLRDGDRIIEVNGKPISRWKEMARIVQGSGGEPIHFLVVRAGEPIAVTVRARAETVIDQAAADEGIYRETKRYLVGISSWGGATRFSKTETRRMNPASALWHGTVQTGRIIGLVFYSAKLLISGEVSVKNLGGPIFILTEGGKAASRGLADYVHLMVLISISLGILNLLPIPILDGGHFPFLIIEKIKGNPLSIRSREIAQQIGLACLLLLMGLALFNDISRYWHNIIGFVTDSFS